MPEKSFIQYYDHIYADKNYSLETDYILKLWHKFGQGGLEKIMDLGCGTGNHCLALAEKGFCVVGVDVSKEMITVAKSKVKAKEGKVDFRCADIIKTEFRQPFDLIYSFFFVINYIGNLGYLEKFLAGVYRNLRTKGLYLFDAWNGNATIIDPPRLKKIKIAEGGCLKIDGCLRPKYNSLHNKSVFYYNLKVKEGGKSFTINHELPQVYWSPYVLIQLLEKTGFKDVRLFKYLKLSEKVSNQDYKICVMGRK